MPAFPRRRQRRTMTPEQAAEATTRITPRYSPRYLRHVRAQAASQAKRAARELVLVVPLMVAIVVVYTWRDDLPGAATPVRIAAMALLVMLGWAFARDVGRLVVPALLRRLEPSTAGTVQFLIRLAALIVIVGFALQAAGLQPQTLALGGAVTAVIAGLAGQQTLSNLMAGTVMLTAQPFRAGDRIRLQGGGLAGVVEGEVVTFGLMHTTLASGADSILVPNALVLSSAIIPLREPASVDLRARLHPEVLPSQVQAILDAKVSVPVREPPRINLEEVDTTAVMVRITATPVDDRDGAQLADQVLAAIARFTTEPPEAVHEDGGGARTTEAGVVSGGESG